MEKIQQAILPATNTQAETFQPIRFERKVPKVGGSPTGVLSVQPSIKLQDVIVENSAIDSTSSSKSTSGEVKKIVNFSV